MLPARKTVKHALHLDNPKLWWPNGYGDPNLYPVDPAVRDRRTTAFRT